MVSAGQCPWLRASQPPASQPAVSSSKQCLLVHCLRICLWPHRACTTPAWIIAWHCESGTCSTHQPGTLAADCILHGRYGGAAAITACLCTRAAPVAVCNCTYMASRRDAFGPVANCINSPRREFCTHEQGCGYEAWLACSPAMGWGYKSMTSDAVAKQTGAQLCRV